MAARATSSLRDLIDLLESGNEEAYPYYCVLIYPPLNGLNQRLHEFVVSHWRLLNTLTGDNCLLVAVEDIDRQTGDFRPEDVYSIARLLGVDVKDIPCMVFFTEPGTRQDTLVLRLGDFLPEARTLTDDDLTDLFQSLQSIIDQCVTTGSDTERLDCLRHGVDSNWPIESRWHDRLEGAKDAFVPSLTATATILQAMMKILPILRNVF